MIGKLQHCQVVRSPKGVIVVSTDLRGFCKAEYCAVAEGDYSELECEFSTRPRPSPDGRFIDYVIGIRKVLSGKPANGRS